MKKPPENTSQDYDDIVTIKYVKYIEGGELIQEKLKLDQIKTDGENIAYQFGWESWAQYLVRSSLQKYRTFLREEEQQLSFSSFSFNDACMQLGMALELIYKILYIRCHKILKPGHLNDPKRGIEFFHQNLTSKEEIERIILRHGWPNIENFFRSVKDLNYINRRYWNVPKTGNQPESHFLVSCIKMWHKNDPDNKFLELVDLCDDLLCFIYDDKENRTLYIAESQQSKGKVGLEGVEYRKNYDDGKDMIVFNQSFQFLILSAYNDVKNRNYDKAIAVLEPLLKINPRHIGVRLNLCLCYVNEKKPNKAIELLAEASTLNLDIESFIKTLGAESLETLGKMFDLLMNMRSLDSDE